MTAFDVRLIEDTRSPVRGHRSLPWRAVAYLLPAIALVGAVIVLPLLWAVVVSFGNGGRGYYALWTDGGIRHAIRGSLVWLFLAPVVCAFGLLLAWQARGVRRLGVLAAPVAVSSLVTAVAFRLLFTPGGPADAMGPHFLGTPGIWVVLGLAFAWQWAGLAIVVFRGGLARIPRDLSRMALAFGHGRWRRLFTVTLPALVPAGALVLIIALGAAARVFELVIITVPGSEQAEADVGGVHWWRWRSDVAESTGAALSVVLFLCVAALALALLWGLSRDWPNHVAEPEASAPGRRGRAVAVLAIAVWLLPMAAVLLTSFHTPEAAASGGWWSGGFGLRSYRDAFASGELVDALSNTAARSVGAALLLVVIAVPAAYALAGGGLSRRTGRILIAVTTVLAVVPPQTVIVELGRVFDDLHLLGAPTALTLVHVAFAVPLAVLLLRAAFVSARLDPARTRLLDPAPGSVLIAVAWESWPAVLTVAVLEFVLVWNDFVVGLLLGGPEAGQVTFVLYDQARDFTTSSGVLAAGAVVATVIPLALVLVTGKWLVRGFTHGVRR
jgi:ABC-type glycerol-3-phosphate transport system permease component